MSLISLRNLAGPFHSKVQMGGLAIAIILVLVIRLGLSRSGDRESTTTGQRTGSEDLLDVLDTASQPKAARRPKPKDDVLDNLVAEGLDEPVPPPTEPQKNESFEDIRKSLGLE